MTTTSAEPLRAQPRASTDIPCVSPTTGESLGVVRAASPADVMACVARARVAQKSWSQSTFAERRAVLGHILEHVLHHADELCTVISTDAGKTRENAMLGEIWPVCEKLRHTIQKGEAALRPERMSAGLMLHKRAVIEYVPLGVIGVIAPWNYPLQNVLGPAIPALFAGNAVIVKVSEHVAWSTARFRRIFEEAFAKAGYGPDVVQLIDGHADAGKALVASGVDKIIFTGSMEHGKKVLEASAATLTPVILELGGKDAFIVCDDARIEQAAHAAMAGVFIAAGQNCLAAERFFVFDAVYDRFVSRVVELASALRQGNPRGEARVDVGAMVTQAQLAVVERLVDDAVKKGARILVGGKRAAHGDGFYFEPTVLADVPEGAAILSEETFGPVMVLSRVADEAEAIARANATQYGLGATVMTASAKRARRMAGAIVAGGTSINDFGFTYMAMDLPFGGVRGSGFGRLNGREGLRACCNQKAVMYDRFPFGAPAKLYPVGSADYAVARGTIRAIYSPTLRAKLAGVREALGAWRSGRRSGS